MNEKSEMEAACDFYDQNYDVLDEWHLVIGKKETLGTKTDRKCRFCGKSQPDVSFRLDAHAIPEALGNKSLFTAYECDDCNQTFGGGIENDLGNWSKPMRTMARIKGKSGVPTIKKGSSGGWRVEYGETGFEIKHYEDDPIVELDEEAKKLTITLRRDPYTPVAVLKAFVKIGLSLIPESEVPNFGTALSWIRTEDHQIGLVSGFPVLYAFVPGPKPFPNISIYLLRRKPSAAPTPYMTYVIAYGNEVFQIFLPSPEKDQEINGQQISIRPFPNPYDLNPSSYGAVRRGTINLMGRDEVKGDVTKITMGFDQANLVAGDSS
tara:strand:- start:5784 stop:6746 length:963 start_codon:yes stop_codon:yes gene_type:complete